MAAAHRSHLRPARAALLLRLGHGLAQARPGPRSPPPTCAASTPCCSATTTTATTSTTRAGPCCRPPAPSSPRSSGAARLGGGARGLRAVGDDPAGGPGRPTIEMTATPCRHGPPLSRPIVGDVIGFALRWEGRTTARCGSPGDTVLYDGVRQVAERMDVDTALLHLGGVRFPVTGPLRYTMTARDGGGAVRPAAPADRRPGPLRGLEALPAGPRGDGAGVRRRAGRRARSLRWLPVGEPVDLPA